MTDAMSEYARLQGECRVLIKMLKETLNAHEKRQAEWPTHWTFVGDVRKTRLELLALCSFLGDEPSREQLSAEGDPR
jgi:hypothetical protein